jgi:alkanesulfonate monooxygenase SsuD/methylene tetrahydromethanopterin reductase-like flavin-dependent oxidoreductase (luciferase family)
VADVESSSLDAVYSGDHVSFHDGVGFDGLVQASALAALSERITVWTAVYLLALRHPVPVARQVAQIAGLAPGRFVFGVGLGGEDPHELEICGVDPRRRGRRLDAHLDVVRALLTGETVHRADEPAIPGATILPTPTPAVPILIGGRSDAALDRVARAGDGWIAIWLTPERAAAGLAAIRDRATELGRRDLPSQHALMVWCGLGPSSEVAQSVLQPAMEGLYKMPFARFERYAPHGRPADVAAAIAPYIELGFGDILLNAVAPSGHDLVALADEVAQHLRAAFQPPARHAK